MATTVASILTQAKALMATSLGASWHQMRNVYDLEKNDLRSATKGYGIRPLGASPVDSNLKYYTLDHEFEVVISNSVPRRDDDDVIETVITDLFDKQDEIFQSFATNKLNLAATILLVSSPTLEEPEFILEGQVIALRQQFTVKYRQAV